MVLIPFAIIIAALLVLSVVAAWMPRRLVAHATAGAAALAALLAVFALADSGAMTAETLPLGAGMRLALEPLGVSFILLLFIAELPNAVCGNGRPLPLAGVLLTALAGDVFTLVAGVLLGATRPRHPRPFVGRVGRQVDGGPAPAAPMGPAGSQLACVVCLIAAFALAGPADDFAVIRAVVPPDGLRAAVILILALVGSGMLARANSGLAAFVLLRVVLDLFGAASSVWWSAPIMLTGATVAVIAALRSALADTLDGAVSAASLHPLGLAAIGFGISLLARSFDLPTVASLALQSAWLALACHVLCGTLLRLFAGAVETGAGTRLLARLGGLMHRMPRTAWGGVAGLFGMSMLPPSLGFAAFWLLFQSLLAATRGSGAGLRVTVVVTAIVTVCSIGLAAIAAVRLFAIAFLGRPRTPRTAVADEAPRSIQFSLLGLSALIGLSCLVPQLVLLPASGWLGAAGSSVLLLRAGSGDGYQPLAVAALFAIVAGAIVFGLRRTAGERRQEAVWSGGFAAPPSWLPFGDPATQYGPAAFVEPLHALLARLPRGSGAAATLDQMWSRIVRTLTALGDHALIVTVVVLVVSMLAWLIAS